MRSPIRTVCLLAALFGGGGLTAWSYWSWRLPDHPDQANREQLFRWLVFREVENEPRSVQVALVNRLEEELRDGLEDQNQVALSETYQQRLNRNILCLKKAWFDDRVDRYQECPPKQRSDYLSRQIETVQIWSEIDLGGDDPEANRHAFTMQFFDDVERWIAEASPPRQAIMTQTVRDGMSCWLATRDLQQEPPATRAEVASLVIAELDAGMKWDAAAFPLTAKQQRTLTENAKLLMESWALEQSEHFATLKVADRSEYLDALFDRVFAWDCWDLLYENTAPASLSEQVQQWTALTDGWIERADPEQQPAVRKFVAAAQRRMMWRQLQQSWRTP